MLYDFPKGEKGMTYGNPVARHREDSPKLHDDWLDYPSISVGTACLNIRSIARSCIGTMTLNWSLFGRAA